MSQTEMTLGSEQGGAGLGWSGQASWGRWGLMLRDGRGKEMHIPGSWRDTEVDGMVRIVGGCHLGTQCHSVCGSLGHVPPSYPCFYLGEWGCGGAWAAFLQHCRLSLPSQDASGAGPGESGVLGSRDCHLCQWSPWELSLVTGTAPPCPAFSAPASHRGCCPLAHIPPAFTAAFPSSRLSVW